MDAALLTWSGTRLAVSRSCVGRWHPNCAIATARTGRLCKISGTAWVTASGSANEFSRSWGCAGMDVIVATASLEVGFNDPEVESVIQHKAPRNVAQFFQRKGRAGRLRSMRPWTVIMLSDYGRDQLAYQAYDQLFDPELPVRTVPLANRYVQRMQAVYSLIDFLGASLQAKGANGNSAAPGRAIRGQPESSV